MQLAQLVQLGQAKAGRWLTAARFRRFHVVMREKFGFHVAGAITAGLTAGTGHFFGLEGAIYLVLFLVFCFGSIWIWTGEFPISTKPTEEEKRAILEDPTGLMGPREAEEDHFWGSFAKGKRPWESPVPTKEPNSR